MRCLPDLCVGAPSWLAGLLGKDFVNPGEWTVETVVGAPLLFSQGWPSLDPVGESVGVRPLLSPQLPWPGSAYLCLKQALLDLSWFCFYKLSC